MIRRPLIIAALLSCLTQLATAQTISVQETNFDRWMYVNGNSPGTRGIASTFSALPESLVDENRLAQVLIGFDTDAPGQPMPDWQAVQITRVTVTASVVTEGGFRYDSTYDPFASYRSIGTDEDTGRPVEIYGTGYRNDYTASTFFENSPHGSGEPYGRNAYAMSFDENGAAVDVSHNVTDNFESNPWGIGTANLAEGASVPADTVFTFDLDVTQPEIISYLRDSLTAGQLFLTLSSLHPSTQQAGEFVNYYTRESTEHQIFGDLAPTLTIEFNDAPLPEPDPIKITALEINPSTGKLDISWNQQTGFQYELQTSTDLTTWTSETTNTATKDGTGTHSATITADQFFRVKRTRPTS